MRGTLVGPQGKDWRVAVEEFQTWNVVLRPREWGNYNADDEVEAWIYDVKPETKWIFVSDSEFGRADFGPNLRHKYLASLRQVAASLVGERSEAEASPDALSEVKGMLNKCRRKDQWDWYTLYETFGRPDLANLWPLVEWLTSMRRATVAGDSGSIASLAGEARAQELGALTQRAIPVVVRAIASLDEVSQLKPLLGERGSKDDASKSDSPWVHSATARVKLERANEAHQGTLKALAAFMDTHGFVIQANRLIDGFCRLKTGPAIFEIKSITATNEQAQCRKALSQLYEYRYVHGFDKASLWVVLSGEPRLKYISDYLERDRDVRLIWRAKDGFDGPSATRLQEALIFRALGNRVETT